MVQNEIKIAIIMPIFQPCYIVNRALNMINQQTKRDNIVVYLISDGSPYSYKKLIKKYNKTLNIIFIKAPINKGPGCIRNLGLNICKEKYVLFHDDDDWLYDEYVIENYIKLIQQNGEYFKSIYGNKKTLWGKDEDNALIHDSFFLGCIFNIDYLNKYNIRFEPDLSYDNEDMLFLKKIEFFNDPVYKKSIHENFICYNVYHDEDHFSICNYNNKYKTSRQEILDVATFIIAQAKILKFYIQNYNTQIKKEICKILKYFSISSGTFLYFFETKSIRGLTQKEFNTLYIEWNFILNLIQKNLEILKKYPEKGIDWYAFIDKPIKINFDIFYNSFNDKFHNLIYLKKVT